MSELDELTETIVISDHLAIPVAELRFRFSRSSGPGGQNVQRSATRVELLFDVAHSSSLTDDQRQRILQRLAGYIDGEGELRIVSSATRSQLENRADAITRFQMLMAAALRRRKHRAADQAISGCARTPADGEEGTGRGEIDAAQGGQAGV